MPRCKSLVRKDRRETDLAGDIARLQGMTGQSFRQLCKKAGINYETFMRHRKNIKQMRYGEVWKFTDTCKREIGEEI